ncbi:MAG: hydroxymethylbilane synthase [Candidatus Nanopelagicales bacterium]|nr:hydroxymethylbilane synthase [Candidatus Nanopelagicales bacterium]
MSPEIRVATRTSPLARAQATSIARIVGELTGRPYSLVTVTSEGDRRSGPLAEMGGVGVFVAAVREAVLAGEADIAVHSLKDLPTAEADGLTLAAVPLRGDHRDALVIAQDDYPVDDPGSGEKLADPNVLVTGARVGTGSPRRAAQLRRLRPDVEVVGIRGNVGTRLSRVSSGDVDAVVVAMAGLQRLGLADRARPWDPKHVLPAPGQGALAIEANEGLAKVDPELSQALSRLNHGLTRASVTAERTLLAELEAGCSAPVGAWAHEDESGPESGLRLTAVVTSVDGLDEIRMTEIGSVRQPEQLGRALAARMLESGAGPAWWENSK